MHPSGLSSFDPDKLSLSSDGVLELCKDAEELEEHSAHGRGGIYRLLIRKDIHVERLKL